MKAINLIVLSITVLLYACGGGTEGGHSMNASGSGINISPEMLGDKIDPICKMDMTKSKIADTLSYNGKLYAFCNPGCKEEFQANPEKYLK